MVVATAVQVKSETDLLDDIPDILQLFMPWTPTAGTAELPNQPINLWQQGKTWSVPMIIGASVVTS